MIISRRSLIASTAGLAAAASARPLLAQTPAVPPMVVYNDGMGDGWSNQSWATVQMDVMAGGHKTIRVEGGPWSGLSLHHDMFATAPYKKLTFFINGGLDGGQTLLLQPLVMGKAAKSECTIQLKAKTWLPASIALKDFGADNKSIDGILFQGRETAYTGYYITNIQFEA